MKPYADLNGKAKWSLFWGDKVKSKIKKKFKKSARMSKSELKALYLKAQLLVKLCEEDVEVF